MAHVLIVDDEPSICWGISELLTEEGHDVTVAPSAEEALRTVADRRPDAILLDVRLPGMDGLTAMQHLRERVGATPIIVMTAFGNLQTAVGSLGSGAFEYLPKPFDLDDVATIVRQALNRDTASHHEATDSGSTDSATGPDPADGEPSLIGRSAPMQRIFKQIALAAGSHVPVLITGESGTGKELVAQAIHRHSARCAGPFLPVCVAALNPQLVESELFGHVKGAFTGADAARTGFLEMAGGGSAFLDEIGDVDPALQVKLLRAIENQEVIPVGGAQPRRTDFRVIAATNRPLAELVSESRFRADLFYRLSVFQIEVPPLRDRREDIPLLARHFLQRADGAGAQRRFSTEALAELCRRVWSGNVRELRNVVERAAIVARGEEIGASHLPPIEVLSTPGRTVAERVQADVAAWARQELDVPAADVAGGLYERFLAMAEPPLIEAVLQHCGGNRAAAARELGMHRATLRERLRRGGGEPGQSGT